ncbi:MAG: PUA domain-containing protein [Candidatus Woesearchaeota archaeon]
MKRLSGSEIKELNKQQSYVVLSKQDRVEVVDDVILVNGVASFFYFESRIVPTLKLNVGLPRVVVDMPAVPFMVNGADVMRPGIKEMDKFGKGDFIVIVDERHFKALAIGLALFYSEDILRMEKGKVIRNLHWVGDRVWNIK